MELLSCPQQRAARYSANYTPFAFFMALNYMLPFFMQTYAPVSYGLILGIKGLGALLCVGLLMEPYWPAWAKAYLPTYWHFSLFYCLSFSVTLLFLINGSSPEWFVNITLAITLFIVLADWSTFVWLAIAGILLGILCYRICIAPLPGMCADTVYTLCYTCISSLLIGFIFTRRKELAFDCLFLRNQYLSKLQRKAQQELAEVINYRETMLKELDTNTVAAFDSHVIAYIKQNMYRITSYLRLNVQAATLDELLAGVQSVLDLQESRPELVIRNQASHPTIQADIDQIKQLLVNSIVYIATAHNKAHESIALHLEDAFLGHEINHLQQYHVRKVAALRFTISVETQLSTQPDVYMIDLTPSMKRVAQDAEKLSLVDSMRIVQAHYGYADIDDSTCHTYVIPADVRSLRDQVMEILREPVAVDPEELRHPLAMALEKELLAALQSASVDLAIVHQALDIIKTYHGGVKRKTGEPFFTHPMAVALIVLAYSQDPDVIVAALLHDIVEDTSLPMSYVHAAFGERVASLVAHVTKLEEQLLRVNLEDYVQRQRLLDCKDTNVALIKLADRLHNMRTLQGHSSATKRKKIAEETLTFFVPMAKNLELADLAQELEKRSIEVLSSTT